MNIEPINHDEDPKYFINDLPLVDDVFYELICILKC